MNTIIKRVDYLDGELASAIAGTGFVTIEKSYVKFMKAMNVTRVVLKTKNAWGKTIQQTYYCILP